MKITPVLFPAKGETSRSISWRGIQLGIARVVAVREAVGDDVDLCIEMRTMRRGAKARKENGTPAKAGTTDG